MINGIIHYRFDEGWYHDDKPGPIHLGNCYHCMQHGDLRGFYVEAVPPYLNQYPFEIGDDRPPLSDSAEDQIRFAMSIASNHSERVQIAALCAPQARQIARALLAEYSGGQKGALVCPAKANA